MGGLFKVILDLVVAGSSWLDLYVSGKPHDLSPFKLREFYKDVKLLRCGYLRVENICKELEIHQILYVERCPKFSDVCSSCYFEVE